MSSLRHALFAIAAAVIALCGPAAEAQVRASSNHWVGAWATTQQAAEPNQALPPDALSGATFRQVVRVTRGGQTVRVRVTNTFGAAPLRIGAARVARAPSPGTPRIDAAQDRPLTFSGQREVVIPPGAALISDPVDLAAPALSHLAVSLYFPAAGPDRLSTHAGSRSTSYYLKGDHTAAEDLPDARRVDRWYQLAGVDVLAGPQDGAIVVLGDSITDGFGVQPNTDLRWTDLFAQRLQASARHRRLSVLNQGLSGNKVLEDTGGPNALARFERDVLAQPGVRYLIVVIGVNDLGGLTLNRTASAQEHAEHVRNMQVAYRQMIDRAHACGVRVIGATILPYAGSTHYKPPPENEADRQAINAWIRQPGRFDGVIDFDVLMRDPARPDRLRAEFDTGDGLHPSLAGYRAMAQFVSLSLFDR